MYIHDTNELYRPVFIYSHYNRKHMIKCIANDSIYDLSNLLDDLLKRSIKYNKMIVDIRSSGLRFLTDKLKWNYDDIKINLTDYFNYKSYYYTKYSNGNESLNIYIFKIIRLKDIPGEDNGFYPSCYYEYIYRGHRISLKKIEDGYSIIIYENDTKDNIIEKISINDFECWPLKAFEAIDSNIINRNIDNKKHKKTIVSIRIRFKSEEDTSHSVADIIFSDKTSTTVLWNKLNIFKYSYFMNNRTLIYDDRIISNFDKLKEIILQ